MPPYWAIGVGAGLIGAVLFLTAGVGSAILGLPLFFAALPVFLAGLGWGSRSALIAAITGFVVLSSISSFTAGLVFLVAHGLGPAWLTHLALLHHVKTVPRLSAADAARLARKEKDAEPPAPEADAQGDEEPPTTDWYPAGPLAVWTALIAVGVLVVSGLSTMAMGVEGGLEGALRMLLAEDLMEGRAIEASLQGMGLNADPERILSLIVIALPAFVVMAWSLLTLGNMWLAQFILERAGHNLRPTPSLLDIEFPHFLLALFLGALVLSLIPGSAAQLGGAIMIALLVPYFLLGLAVIHAISRAWTARIAFLGVFYILLIFTGWLIVPICLIGLGEPWANLRARFAQSEAPSGKEIS